MYTNFYIQNFKETLQRIYFKLFSFILKQFILNRFFWNLKKKIKGKNLNKVTLEEN